MRIEAACWILGLALLATYAAVRVWAEEERAAAVARLSAPPPAVNRPVDVELAAPDQSLWSRQRIAAFAALARAEPPRPMGVLRAPALGLEVPVFAGVTEANLTRGVALIDANRPLDAGGNIGIAGHRDGFFRVLENVRIGDVLLLDTGRSVRRYVVSELAVVRPTDVHVLGQTREDALTLVTCFPFYFVGPAPGRYIVRALRDTDIEPARSFTEDKS